MLYFQAFSRYVIILTLEANFGMLELWHEYNDFNGLNDLNILEEIRRKEIGPFAGVVENGK